MAAVLLAASVTLAAHAEQLQLPNGASSVSEVYQDWQVLCTQLQEGKRCSVSQQQSDPKSNQRVFVIELQPQGDKAEGALVLPFGLLLEKGVILKVGDSETGPVLRFKTCLPQGCIVPFSLDAKTIAALRKATVLTVAAAGANDQPITVSASLKGFSQALDRGAALLR